MRNLRRGFPYFWLIFQPILFYWNVVVQPSRHIPYDLEAYHYPTLAYIAACIRQGQWPFWDPYTYAGMPLHADPQAQMFYPPAWIAMALGNLSAGRDLFYWVEWMVPAHMMLAGLFTYLLLRRMKISEPAAILGATVYQLGGFFASQACHLGAVCAGAWLPLAILAVFSLRDGLRARSFALLTLAMALTILAGYAPTTIVVAGAVILYCLFAMPWRVLPGVIAAFVLAALVCAVQLAPMLRLTALSIASLRSGWLTAWGAPIESLVSLALPNYYGIFDLSRYQLLQNFTLLYIYCGLIPLGLLLLAPFRRHGRVFAALTLVSGVWMLGEHTPVYPLVFSHLPQLIRGASYAWYAMMAFGLFAGITAAMVLDGLRSRVPAALLWAMAVATSFDLLHAGRNRPMNTAEGSYRISSSEYQYGQSADDLRKLHELVNGARPPLRMDYADLWAPGVIMGGMLQLPTPDGNIPFMQRRMFLLRRLFGATEPSARDLAIAGAQSPIFRRNLPVNRFDSQLLRMLNVGFVASSDPVPNSTLSVAGLNLYRVQNPLPRFYLTPTVWASAGLDQTFALLAEPAFDPAREAIAEGVPARMQGLGAGTVRVISYAPERVELLVKADGPGFLATSEAYYPGWRAMVNGRAQPLMVTNGAFRGLEIPGGNCTVVMSYWPVDFTWSAFVSLAAMAFTVGCAFHRINRAVTVPRIVQNVPGSGASAR